MITTGIIGSGNLGANTAFFLAERGVSDVILYDIREGTAPGKALDMMEAAPVRGYPVRVRGTDDLDEVLGAEYLVIAAGAGRASGGTDSGRPVLDMYDENRPLVEDLARKVAGRTGRPRVVILATEPVDLMTEVFIRTSGLPERRILGLGRVPDSVRFRKALSERLGLSWVESSAVVAGGPGSLSVFLSAYARFGGIPAADLAGPDDWSAACAETVRRETGDSTAGFYEGFYGAAAGTADLLEAICRGFRRVMSVSVRPPVGFGLGRVPLGLPAFIGPDGIDQVPSLSITEDERGQLDAVAATYAGFFPG
jgi:malate dehydrogenase